MDKTSADSKLRVGVIGVGHWGPNVARNISQHPRAVLGCLCDTNEGMLTRAKGSVMRGYSCEMSAEAVFANPEIDAVVVSTDVGEARRERAA